MMDADKIETIDQFIDLISGDQNVMMLAVTINMSTMTTTCIGSNVGLKFLNYKAAKLDVCEQLIQFLSDQFKTTDVQVKKKLYTNISTEELCIPINIPCDKGKTHTVKNQTDRKRKAQEGTVCMERQSERKFSARSRKLPKRFQDDILDSSVEMFLHKSFDEDTSQIDIKKNITVVDQVVFLSKSPKNMENILENKCNRKDGLKNTIREVSDEESTEFCEETEKSAKVCEDAERSAKELIANLGVEFVEDDMTGNNKGNSSFPCRQCNVTLPSELSRTHHEVSDHDLVIMIKSRDNTLTKPYKCPICRSATKTEDGMKIHIHQHCQVNPNELTCTVCKLQFKTKRRLNAHILIHNDANFPCDICGKKFRMLKYVRRHKVETHKTEFTPKHSKENIKNTENRISAETSGVAKEEKNINSEANQKNSGDDQCDDLVGLFNEACNSETAVLLTESIALSENIENKTFSENKERKPLSENIESNTNECPISDNFSSSSDDNNVIKSERITDELSTCTICSESFEKVYELSSHMKTKHFSDLKVEIESRTDNKDERLKCGQCQAVTFSTLERVRHEIKEHNLIVMEKYDGMQKKCKVKCPICKISRKAVSVMKLHIHQHFETNVSELTCSICKLQFKTKHRLQNHIPIHNKAEFPCNICGKKFRMLRYVKRHIAETHNAKPIAEDTNKDKEPKKKRNFTPGICDVCGKTFSTQYQALQHRSIHSDDKPYFCTKCQKKFRLQSTLKTHMAIHKETKNYICELCGKSFKIPQGLRMHQARYHDNKDFTCDVCGLKFLSFSGKKYHILKKHKGLAEQSGYRLYPCKFCDRVSASHQDYLRHETTHIDNKTNVCDICNSRWATVSQLNVHRKIHLGGIENNYVCKICKFKSYTPWKMKRHLASTKHIENAAAAGYVSVAIAADINNKDIVETKPLKRQRIENEIKDHNEIDPSQLDVEVEQELHEATVDTYQNAQDQKESDDSVEVKYYEIPSNIEDGAHIIYTESGEMIYSIVEGEHTYICDQNINQAVESILKLKHL